MKPIRLGDRGPAVQDIQRRLRLLGHDLGPTGVDGVFLGRTAEAVREFQARAGINEDAIVGPETWSALVDATFTLGDRMLYLRLPHFHGRDVTTLQTALNALGFTCGDIDGIFGSFTERALVEFQRNAGLPADGIAGDDTVGALMALRHVWDGKDASVHSAARPAPARAASVLERVPFAVTGLDAKGTLVAERMVNLASATSPTARCALVGPELEPEPDVVVHLLLHAGATSVTTEGRPVVRLGDRETLVPRLLTAVQQLRQGSREVVVDLTQSALEGEHDLQRTAVWLLDALCFVFD